jgi:hypothetical protein
LTHRTAKVGTALLAVYVMWGSVYVAIRVVVEEAPPLASIGLRYVVAAVLLGLLAVSRGGLQTLALDRTTALSCLLLAILLPGLANGLVTIAVSEGVAAGPAALLTALSPLIIVLLRLANHDRPPRMTLVGVVIGFAGLAVLLLLGRPSTGFPLWPSVLVLVAANCWALGSFIQPRLVRVAGRWAAAHRRGPHVRRAHQRGLLGADVVDARLPDYQQHRHVHRLHLAAVQRTDLLGLDPRVRQPGGGGVPGLVAARRALLDGRAGRWGHRDRRGSARHHSGAAARLR